MSIFDKWNQVQPKEVSGPQKGYMVLNKSRTQILSSPNGRMHSRETPYCCGEDYYLWDDRQEDVELNLEHNPNRIFLIEREDGKSKNEKFTYNFYQVSDTPTPPTLDEYSVEDKVLFIKSYEDCFPRPGFYLKFVESSSFEELNRTRKTLIDRLNVVKSRLVHLVQNDDTED